MNGLRASTVLLSMALHGALIGWMMHVPMAGPESFEAGAGNDQMTVENAISIEGPLMVGDAVETIQAQEIAPAEVVQAVAPVQEIKPDELTDVITSKGVDAEPTVVAAEPQPVQPVPPPPVQMAALALPEQTAVDTHASSGKAKAGGDPTLQRKYLGSLSKSLEKRKVFPKSHETGTVWVRFTVSPSGALLSREVATSSGSARLDEAAVLSLERAAPFPPMPDGTSSGPMVVSVPFRYIER